MENLELKSSLFIDIISLISESCSQEKITRKSQDLHEMILKRHYNAADISIDYHRKRIFMDIVVDDSNYDTKELNFSTPLMKTNMYYGDLEEFLISCIDYDNSSIAFYRKILNSYLKSDSKMVLIA
ncbi:MAG: hypothetical protein R3243_05325 [Arenibacter latericius]|nr:hypothetical protein [Arenibacter latericius]